MLTMHAIGQSTPLSLTAGENGEWTIVIIVDEKTHILSGKNIRVVQWEHTAVSKDGATASGTLSLYGPA